MKTLRLLILTGIILSQVHCKEPAAIIPDIVEPDPHSFSRPSVSSVKHLDLDLKLNFERKIITGTACYDLAGNHGEELILDQSDLIIDSVFLAEAGNSYPAKYHLGTRDSILGSPLVVKLNPNTKTVCVQYSTTDKSKALQWLPREQTLNKKYPFLFTQSQSIYARSWIPCPDGPGMRFTYRARVEVPEGMMAVMSAENVQHRNPDGIYEFNMEYPIPAYLLALAVGDFDFKPLGQRTGVYAEPALLDKAVIEFDVLETMLITAENLYGEYPWKRYDVIVLPGSFPFGGMENPRMTFLTPSVLAGDKSLTALLAHELAHSWSGNLVTNASWNDFWLNEGFTTYFESRIMESVYGKPYADMLSILGLQDLQKTLDEIGKDNPLTKLKLDLKSENPEDALSDIAYEKGKALLRFLEERLGRNRWDNFLRTYFAHFRFRSNTSEGFLQFLSPAIAPDGPGLLDTVRKWIYEPGLPEYHPDYDRLFFNAIDHQLVRIVNTPDYDKLECQKWSTHEWLYFIRKLPKDKNQERCLFLETRFHLSQRNFEIQCVWLEYVILNLAGKDFLPAIRNFLSSTGRRKYLMPVYKAMKDNDLEKEALSIFNEVKFNYHPITLESVNDLLR